MVISSFFADIHKQNELNCFVLPVTVSEEFLAELFATISADPAAQVRVDLPSQTVTNISTGRAETFDINPYKKQCLSEGLDDVEYLLSRRQDTEAWEAARR